MKQPFFSIVIPSYDRQTLLNEAVESVLAQTDPDWELIIVDDASPTPLQVVNDSRIHLVRQQANAGKPGALNRALRLARGEVIAFLDDDDLWSPDRLAYARAAHSLAQVAVCGGGEVGDETSPTARRQGSSPRLRMMKQSQLNKLEMPGPMGATSVRMEVCPEFDESFRACEDLEWGIRLLSEVTSIVEIESRDFIYRSHDGPRYLNGRVQRIAASKRLLKLHGTQYQKFPKKRAYRLYRIGSMTFENGDKSEAFMYAVRSVVRSPSLRGLRLLARLAVGRCCV